MEINKRTLFLIAIGAYLFLFLSDAFKQQNFQTNFKDFLNTTMGNSTTHSLMNWFVNKTNSIAGFVSVSSISILNALPVIF